LLFVLKVLNNMIGMLLGKKKGMTQVFKSDGSALPVTVVELLSGYISQIKSKETDGYSAVKLAFGERKRNLVNRAEVGSSSKLGMPVPSISFEVRVSADQLSGDGAAVGAPISCDLNEGDVVDVIAVSKGKGFAGAVKRWGFACQDATHGNSLSHRAPGSIGQRQSPGRVFKGKKMSGHMGASRCTIRNLEVVKFMSDEGLLLIKGVVPGAVGGSVMVRRVG